MQRAFFTMIFGAFCAAFLTTLGAQELPKSGTFTVQSGWKTTGDTVQIDEGHIYGHGNFWGVVFNDKGSGPLHRGPVSCPYSVEVVNGVLSAQGKCAWSDVDGDKIFTDWTGSMPPNSKLEGLNQITGGTGKYAGIKGRAPFQCIGLNGSGQWACTQQFTYRLP